MVAELAPMAFGTWLETPGSGEAIWDGKRVIKGTCPGEIVLGP